MLFNDSVILLKLFIVFLLTNLTMHSSVNTRQDDGLQFGLVYIIFNCGNTGDIHMSDWYECMLLVVL